MTIRDRFKAAAKSFRTQDNSMGTEFARDFLRRGNARPLVQDWSKVVMTDKDLYSGYPYAAINNRANKVAQLAKNNLKTDASDSMMTTSRLKQEEIIHPYVDIIDTSTTFSNYKFWYDISTFLDLVGVYYLFVLRTVEGDRIGNPLEFKLLNPYNVRRIINKQTLEVGGYVEGRDGLVREFKPKMIIEMRKLNPFSDEDPFSMTDAAKESQFTLKQAGDYTRHSLKNNMAAPGIISTDMLLDPEQFKNFVSRVTNQEKGLPLFGNGSGAVKWDSMQIDLDKASLDKINEINRQGLFAVSGVGKTLMAIEESGTTRETAKVQKDLFIENHAMPQLQLIIDALNQDYKTNYEAQYKMNQYCLEIDNPLGTDREAELKDIEIRDAEWKLYDKLVAEGYKRDLASKYASGEITLEELGEPTEEPRPNPVIEAAKLKNPQLPPPVEEKPKKKNAFEFQFEHAPFIPSSDHVPAVRNEFDDESQGILASQQAALQNAIQGIEGRITNSVLNKVFKVNNAFENESDVMTQSDKNEYVSELAMVLGAFYGIVMPIFASATLAARTKEFNQTATFKMTAEVKKYIKAISAKAAQSHVTTVVEDLRKTVKNQFDLEVQRQVNVIESTGRSVTDEDLVMARKKALEGASRVNITNAVKKEYADEISKSRAKAIARTEMNRAFTQSQYQADLQFLKQNNLESKAFKKWVTRSDNPCPICQGLAAQPPIPFKRNFADIGDVLSATYKDDKGKTKVLKQPVNFEELAAGNAHVNCSCRYMLIIQE